MPEVLSRASKCFLNGFPPKDCGNDVLNTLLFCNIKVIKERLPEIKITAGKMLKDLIEKNPE